jgi:three-Cys-motif partner protein
MNEDSDQNQGRQPCLFDMSKPPVDRNPIPAEPLVVASQVPVWTDNKAKFIRWYLHYFVLITKHGTYIDGFAGPQQECETDSWAAKLVLESEPRWLRHFHLCDANASQVKRLEALKAAQPECDLKGRKLSRDIHIYRGDFNVTVDEILAANSITENEATFCLLDQRTFECDWATVEKLARYKTSGHKIELFYFLANGWFERALSGQKDLEKLTRWWGRVDWNKLSGMSREERRDAITQRMKRDLRYRSVKAWPIYERKGGGAIMYYMIHATDHPEAPSQMARAYKDNVLPFEKPEQYKFWAEPKDTDFDPGPQTSVEVYHTA